MTLISMFYNYNCASFSTHSHSLHINCFSINCDMFSCNTFKNQLIIANIAWFLSFLLKEDALSSFTASCPNIDLLPAMTASNTSARSFSQNKLLGKNKAPTAPLISPFLSLGWTGNFLLKSRRRPKSCACLFYTLFGGSFWTIFG